MTEPMKALVVRQPWATLISLGIKTIETRPWPPNGPMRPPGVRGLPGCVLEQGERIAIVAGAAKPAAGPVGGGFRVRGEPDSNVAWLTRVPDPLDDMTAITADLPLGVVVCTVEVFAALPVTVGCAAGDHIAPFVPGPPAICRGQGDEHIYLDIDGPLGDYAHGRWGWMLRAVQPTNRYPVKGKQGVFRLPADVSAQVHL